MSAPESNPPAGPAHAGPLDSAARVRALQALPRRAGEASFFWYEPRFDSVAVKVLPGEYFVASEALVIMTTLGSCIATCLWDRQAGLGGLNHFVLADGGDGTGRHGAFAMGSLIEQLVKQGATRGSIEAKVFGGGQVIAGMSSINVGQRNTQFVLDYLEAERIPVIGNDLLGSHPRRVCFWPQTGKAMVKRLPPAHAETVLALEHGASVRRQAADNSWTAGQQRDTWR